MHHRHHGHGPGRIHFRGPFPNRQDLLERLESYQRDLEQERALADGAHLDVRDLRHVHTATIAPACAALCRRAKFLTCVFYT